MDVKNNNYINVHFKKSIINSLIFIIISNFVNIYPQEKSLQQDQSQSEILSLEKCINLALQNNHKIKAQRQEVLKSEIKKKQAESVYWPQISARAIYSYLDQDLIFRMPEFQMSIPQIPLQGFEVSLPPINIPQQDIKLMDKQNLQAFLEMSFPIYTGGKITALNRQAERGIEIARQDYRKSNLEICYNTICYYYGVVLSRKIYKIATDALDRLDITLKLTQSTYENGSGKVTRLDYLKNKVLVDQVRALVSEMKKNVVLSKEALAFTMGINTSFELADQDLPFIKGSIQLVNSEEPAYSGNPDWAKANEALLYYQAKYDEAYSGFFPNIAITGSFAKNFNSFKSGITNKFNNQIWMVGLGTEIPLFNGFRTTNEVNEAQVQIKKTEEEKLLLQDALNLQVKEALKRVEIAVEKIDELIQAKVSANENCSLTERAFQQDMAEAKDLIEAQILESLVEVQYQKALYDYNEAKANLNFITGKDLYKDIMVEN